MSDYQMSHELPEPTQPDGSPMPIKVTHATIGIDYQNGTPVRAKLEGYATDQQGIPLTGLDADCIVTGRDGRKYRLVPAAGEQTE